MQINQIVEQEVFRIRRNAERNGDVFANRLSERFALILVFYSVVFLDRPPSYTEREHRGMVMESVKVQDARGRWTAGDPIHELSDREKSCDYSLYNYKKY